MIIYFLITSQCYFKKILKEDHNNNNTLLQKHWQYDSNLYNNIVLLLSIIFALIHNVILVALRHRNSKARLLNEKTDKLISKRDLSTEKKVFKRSIRTATKSLK